MSAVLLQILSFSMINQRRIAKVSSPENQALVSLMLSASDVFPEVNTIIHGTTVTTNAILERKLRHAD